MNKKNDSEINVVKTMANAIREIEKLYNVLYKDGPFTDAVNEDFDENYGHEDFVEDVLEILINIPDKVKNIIHMDD